MKGRVIILLSLLIFVQWLWADNGTTSPKAVRVEHELQVSAGTVERYFFHSDFVDARNVDIWLPENYSPKKKYAVLYMHDGQMLYDAGKAWNAREWDVETTLTKLRKEGKIRDVIVVGIYNNGNKRHIEYFPEKAIPYIGEPEHDKLWGLLQGAPLADAYLRFLVTELKPFIDKQYSTKTNRKNTFLCGSSMGGLISIYGMCEYPKVFGGAACLSTHWIGHFDKNEQIPAGLNEYLRKHLPSPSHHKIYFDHGTVGLDANYPEFQKQVDVLVREAGYTKKNFLSLEFPGENHNETYWSARLHIPLAFILAE
jgi:enterochelin esterase-like enzyme